MAESSPGESAPRALGLRDLTIFNLAAVVGIRWIAAAAHVGVGSVSLWLLAAGAFFVPSALVVSALSRDMPVDGGIYVWTRRHLGPWLGFLCGWTYWIGNIFYFPQLLLSGVAVAARAAGPKYQALADDPVFVVGASLVILWIAVGTNIVGLKVGKWTESLGGIATYLVGGGMIALGVAVFEHQGGRLAGLKALSFQDFLPHWDWDRLNFWSQITFAFGGLELAPILCGEIRNPERTIPRAAWLSGALICIFYILGTLAILCVIPAESVNPVDGLIQAFHLGAQTLQSYWGWAQATVAGVTLVMGGLFALSMLGQLGAWMVGSARLPATPGMAQCFPSALSRIHPKWKTPYVSLLFQGVACSAFLVAGLLGESVRSGYQLLVDMTVLTYFLPFALLFLAAAKRGLWVSGAIGFAVTLTGLVLTFVPPGDAASPWAYEAKVVVGIALVGVIGRVLYVRGSG